MSMNAPETPALGDKLSRALEEIVHSYLEAEAIRLKEQVCIQEHPVPARPEVFACAHHYEEYDRARAEQLAALDEIPSVYPLERQADEAAKTVANLCCLSDGEQVKIAHGHYIVAVNYVDPNVAWSVTPRNYGEISL